MDKEHAYPKVLRLIDLTSLCKELHDCYSSTTGAPGIEIERAFKAMLIQQLKDKGVVKSSFHFLDSIAITTKISLWEEYDKAHAKEAPQSL